MIIWTVLRKIVIDSSIVTPDNTGRRYKSRTFFQEIENIKKKIIFRQKLQEAKDSNQINFLSADLSINFIPSDNFSPESGGRVKSRTAMEEIKRQGTIKLKK